MTMFSWLEFKEYWMNSSGDEYKTFFIWLAITLFILIGIGIIDCLVRKKSRKTIQKE